MEHLSIWDTVLDTEIDDERGGKGLTNDIHHLEYK